MAKKLYGTSISLPAPFEAGSCDPVDARLVVENKSDLTTNAATTFGVVGSYCKVYEGISVYVSSEKAIYTYMGPAVTGSGILLSEVLKESNWILTSKLSSPVGDFVTKLLLGKANGVATLDGSGKIPSNQLPSYVDDIIDVYATYTKSEAGAISNITLYLDAAKTLKITGEAGKIYLNVTTGEPAYQFRWTGSVFAQTGATGLVIGEISGTAYDGLKGKTNAENIKTLKDWGFIKDIVGEDFDPSNGLPIVLWDAEREAKVIIECSEYTANKYPISRYTPIGIVVIPASHTDEFLPEGDPRKGRAIMRSLKYMRLDSPEVGGEALDMFWGNGDILELHNHELLPVITNTATEFPEDSIVLNAQVTFPSDKFNTEESLAMPGTFYPENTINHCPSPYIKQNNVLLPNKAYYKLGNPEDPSATSDLNGVDNTKKIIDNLDLAAQPNWETDDAIIGVLNKGPRLFPPAMCCLRYHTPGTNPKDWYLPAYGELGYVFTWFNKDALTCLKINAIKQGSAIPLVGDPSLLWSSTQSNPYNYAYALLVTDGRSMKNYYGGSINYALAFCVV